MSTVSRSHLCSLYMEQLRDLHPKLPQVIEHLVKENILTRGEVSKVCSTSDQYRRLCQLLASKGAEKEAAVIAEITCFRESGKNPREGPPKKDIYTKMMNGHEEREVDQRQGKVGKPQLSRHTVDVSVHQDRQRRKSAKSTHHKDVIVKETFPVQFFTFITQLLLTPMELDPHRPESASALPAWIQVDISGDQVHAYFPSQLRKSRFHRKIDQLDSISLSNFLSAFRTFHKRFNVLEHENKLLASKANLVQSLTERNAHLEDEIWKLRKHNPLMVEVPQHIEEEEVQIQKQCSRLESRNKELVGINEQWALECQEKMSHITALEVQLEDAKSEIKLLQANLKSCQEHLQHKLKLRVHEHNGLHSNTSENDQTMIRQMQLERDEAVGENIHLKGELEKVKVQRSEYKDEIEELKDRVANFKIQAQRKEPLVAEFARLSSENSQLREAMAKMKEENENNKDGGTELPPFFDLRPLTPEKSTTATNESKVSDSDIQKKQFTPMFLPPNQPVAEVIGGFSFPADERTCPKCRHVFMMIGEREFQSHVAGCRN